MLRDEQIDIRKQRARQGKFAIANTGKNRFLSTFTVTNTENQNQYTVQFRCFTDGENTCTCPDFRTNTLRTCKHIEVVKACLETDSPPTIRQRRFSVKDPEITLDYGECLCLVIHLPDRHSDRLKRLASKFFDSEGLWKADGDFALLRAEVEEVPERVHYTREAEDFIDLQIDRAKLQLRERELLLAFDSGNWIPDLLKVPLYDYQVRGAIFLACRGRSILGDDMGLGKTVQTLAAVELLVRERNIQRVLVVAPASVKYQWQTEILKFTGRTAQIIDGRNYQREEQYRESTFYRLVNYEQVIRDLPLLNAWQPDVIVIDEAQRIKNWESESSRSVKRLRSRFAIALTGTPLENRLEELYSIVQFIDDRLLGPAFQFLSDHRVLNEAGQIVKYCKLDEIRQKIAPILLRRTRDEVLTELPERIDHLVFVELSPEQRTIYDEEKLRLVRLLQHPVLSDLDRRRILASVNQLRMICNSTFLIDRETNHSLKLLEFDELIREWVREDGRKIVVFSQWEMMIRKAAEVLESAGIGYTSLHGKIPAGDRGELLDRFRDDPNCRVFLSTDAGGVGLNLQSADTVVNLEMPWNPATFQQRVARVHRMGQKNPVRVVNLVTCGTIEERVLQIQEQKQLLFQGLFDSDSIDEVAYPAIQNPGIFEQLRETVEDPDSVVKSHPSPPVRLDSPPVVAPSARPIDPAGSAQSGMILAGIELLEAITEMLRHQPNLLTEQGLRRASHAGESFLQVLRQAAHSIRQSSD